MSIVKKIHNIYWIEEVQLSEPTTRDVTPQVSVWQQKTIAAAYNTSLMHSWHFPSAQAPSRLRSLSIDWSQLGLPHIAAICSALHYDCSIETVCFEGIIRAGTKDVVDEVDRAQCWRWLAYGMFYPRSKKLSADNKFRSLDISARPFQLGEASAFKTTPSAPCRRAVLSRTIRATARDKRLLL